MKKCIVCRKKVNPIYMISCKCNQTLCLEHRFPDKHDCSYNHVKQYKDRLNKELVKVEHQKIQKI